MDTARNRPDFRAATELLQDLCPTRSESADLEIANLISTLHVKPARAGVSRAIPSRLDDRPQHGIAILPCAVNTVLLHYKAASEPTD